MRELPNPNRPRERFTQAILDSDGYVDTKSLEILKEYYPPRPYNFDLKFDGSDSSESLEDEVRTCIYNYNAQQSQNAGIVGAKQLLMLECQTRLIDEYIREGYLAMPDLEWLAMDQGLGLHPQEFLKAVEIMAGLGCESVTDLSEIKDAHRRSSVGLDVIHARLRRAHTQLLAQARSINVKVPLKLLSYLPEEATTLTAEEQDAILCGRTDIDFALNRRRAHEQDEKNEWKNQYINGLFLMGGIFAASWAVEEAFPGISPYETTRVLLKNAHTIGKLTYATYENPLYIYATLATNSAERGTFPALVELATNKQKMEVDREGVLYVPLQPKHKGRCPAANAYVVSNEQRNTFEAWRNAIEERYDARLHRQNPGTTVSIATENAMMGILVGENFISGRTRQIVQDFRKNLLGRTATGLLHLRDMLR